MVPVPILSSVFFFQRCRTTTSATAISSGSPWLSEHNLTPFQQYTTSVAIMAQRSTRPRYCTISGTFLFPNTKKGKKRIAMVVNALTAIIKIECVMPLLPPLLSACRQPVCGIQSAIWYCMQEPAAGSYPVLTVPVPEVPLKILSEWRNVFYFPATGLPRLPQTMPSWKSQLRYFQAA